MAQHTYTKIVSDLSNTEGAVTVRFAFENASYEIDVTSSERDEFIKHMETYINAARRSGTVGRPRTAGSATRTDKAQLDAIRSWARDNGMKVSDRGRISNEVVSAYNAAKAAPPARTDKPSKPVDAPASTANTEKAGEIFSDKADPKAKAKVSA